MPNPYVNKVIVDGVAKIDITDTTAVAADVMDGTYFYLASGEKVEGTLVDGDLLSYGSSSYLVGTAKIGTGYVWTEYSGSICIADKSIVGTASAV